MKVINVDEAIQIAGNDGSLEGYAIKDLGSHQVKAKDALLLARQGILLPEQNILYRDEDVVYDPEFDDHEWTLLPGNPSLEDLAILTQENHQDTSTVVSIDLDIEDQDIVRWAKQNHIRLKTMFSTILKEMYITKESSPS